MGSKFDSTETIIAISRPQVDRIWIFRTSWEDL